MRLVALLLLATTLATALVRVPLERRSQGAEWRSSAGLAPLLTSTCGQGNQARRAGVPLRTRFDGVVTKWPACLETRNCFTRSVPSVPMTNDYNEVWVGTVAVGQPQQLFRLGAVV